MATDVEESDTEDDERPVPSKRQRTRPLRHEEKLDDPKESTEAEENGKEEGREYDETERLTREKLNAWQSGQVVKGFLDNIINRMLEDYTMHLRSAYSEPDYSQILVFRGDETEDVDSTLLRTAVATALRNTGLDLVTDVRRCDAESTLEAPSSSGMSDRAARTDDAAPRLARTIDDEVRTDERAETGGTIGNAETDREQDFLERAVAEAIKKKGLNPRSLDYG